MFQLSVHLFWFLTRVFGILKHCCLFFQTSTAGPSSQSLPMELALSRSLTLEAAGSWTSTVFASFPRVWSRSSLLFNSSSSSVAVSWFQRDCCTFFDAYTKWRNLAVSLSIPQTCSSARGKEEASSCQLGHVCDPWRTEGSADRGGFGTWETGHFVGAVRKRRHWPMSQTLWKDHVYLSTAVTSAAWNDGICNLEVSDPLVTFIHVHTCSVVFFFLSRSTVCMFVRSSSVKLFTWSSWVPVFVLLLTCGNPTSFQGYDFFFLVQPHVFVKEAPSPSVVLLKLFSRIVFSLLIFEIPILQCRALKSLEDLQMSGQVLLKSIRDSEEGMLLQSTCKLLLLQLHL